jgi:putative transposase
MHAHMVFVTKYRHQVFSSRHLERTEQTLPDASADFGCELAGCNGKPGHLHLLVNFPPRHRHLTPPAASKGRVLPQVAAGIP